MVGFAAGDGGDARRRRASRSLSEAGRTLFAVSRLARRTANDADRLRKYLARFGLDWETARRGS